MRCDITSVVVARTTISDWYFGDDRQFNGDVQLCAPPQSVIELKRCVFYASSDNTDKCAYSKAHNAIEYTAEQITNRLGGFKTQLLAKVCQATTRT
jgi:hypothetical protein